MANILLILLTLSLGEAEIDQFYEDLQNRLELTPQKDVFFIIGDWNAKWKSRVTWSNRQVWPWSTKSSRAKANRVFLREYTGHSKHPLPTTQEKTLHISSVRFSSLVMSDSLQPHEPQHTRPPCLSPTPRVHPNPCPPSQWCHPTISSSITPFSSCPQSFPESGSFQISQLFASGGQSIGVWASTSVPPMNTQDWSPLGWTGWISLSRVFFNTTVQKHQFFGIQLSL